MKVLFDSNIFGNEDIILWFYANKEKFKISMSVISYVETLLWYRRHKKQDLFEKEIIEHLDIKIISLDKDICKKTVENAIISANKLPFKHHFRDYVIGTTAILNNAILLTYNLSHFRPWISEKKAIPPEEFISSVNTN